MTGLAFTLVVGLMTVMLASSTACTSSPSRAGVPGNVVVLADGALDELFSNLGYGDIKELELHPLIEKGGDGKPLASWEVYVVVNQPIAVRKCPVCGQLATVEPLRPEARAARRAGVCRLRPERDGHARPALPPGARRRRPGAIRRGPRPRFVRGRPVVQPGRRRAGAGGQGETAIQAVIGEGLSRELGPDQGKKALEVGDYFDLGPRKWIVVGVLMSGGSTFDSEVWSKFQIVGEQFGKKSYTTCVVRAADKEKAATLAKDLSDNYKKPAVTASIEEEYYSRMNTTNQQFL